ncbi:MAG: rod-binding protein [Desulfovibrionaceae bacterium]|nr:rod-binding protein [Desulfovibrionaceae bacterium]
MSVPIDPRVAAAGYSEDPIKKKLQIDELRKHIQGGENKEKQLRQACQDFEAVFIQKIWEQMRKSIPKDGYLHSRDEEMYQSMFDVEFSKKMASAGGIGLADMLYEQLNVKLGQASRATSPSMLRNSQEMQALNQEKGIRLEPHYGSLKRDAGTEYALNQSKPSDPNGIYSEYREEGIEYINPYAQSGLGNSVIPEENSSVPEQSGQAVADSAAASPDGVEAWQRNLPGMSAYTGNLQHDVNAVGSISAARQRAVEEISASGKPMGIGAGTPVQSNFSDSVKFIDPMSPGGLAEAPFSPVDMPGRSQYNSLNTSQYIPGFTGMKAPFASQQGTGIGAMGMMKASVSMSGMDGMGLTAPGGNYSLNSLVLESMGELLNETSQPVSMPAAGNVVVPPAADTGMPGSLPVNSPSSMQPVQTGAVQMNQQPGQPGYPGASIPSAGVTLGAERTGTQAASGSSIPEGMFMRFDTLPEI